MTTCVHCLATDAPMIRTGDTLTCLDCYAEQPNPITFDQEDFDNWRKKWVQDNS